MCAVAVKGWEEMRVEEAGLDEVMLIVDGLIKKNPETMKLLGGGLND